jgi:hypothetical protein
MSDRILTFRGAIAAVLLTSGLVVAGCSDDHVVRTTTTERTTGVQQPATVVTPAPMATPGTTTTTTTKQTTVP